MRELLLRVQSDPEFAELVRSRPDAAAAGFELNEDELGLLKKPDWSLNRFLVPAHRIDQVGFDDVVAEPDMVNAMSSPPDQEPPPDLQMTLPDTTLPDLSQLLVTSHHPSGHPLEQPTDKWKSMLEENLLKKMVAEVKAANPDERRAKLVDLLDGVWV